MEPPKTPRPARPSLDLHPLPEESLEINTEFCEESVTYSELRIHYSSNIQKENVTRNLKIKESPWALAAVVFAGLYLIVLVIAAIMIAKACKQLIVSEGDERVALFKPCIGGIHSRGILRKMLAVQYLERMLKAQGSYLQNETAH